MDGGLIIVERLVYNGSCTSQPLGKGDRTKMEKYDLIVIGSGSGLDVANAAAASDMRVCIIEKGALGGTCLNRGCIPSKIIIHSADVAMTIRRAADFGIHVGNMEVDFAAITTRASRIVDEDSAGIEEALLHHVENPHLVQGEAQFTAEKTLRVGNKTLKADRILIATGARPHVPEIAGLQESGFITSDEALRLQEQPGELIILGGGFIAAELGHFFGALGTRVKVIHRRPLLLRHEDTDIAAKFTDVFRRYHDVTTNVTPVEVRRSGNRIIVTTEDNRTGERREIDGDTLLVATGRVPNTDTLNLGSTGVQVNDAGFVQVDEYLETNTKGIYALGDVVGRYLYKHNANHEAQYAYWNMVLGHRVPVDYSAMPHAVFSYPQVAGVGLTEQQCAARKIAYSVGHHRYADTGMGSALQEEDGFVKLLVERENGKILGCHITGPEAATLIQEAVVAMQSGKGTLGNILHAIHVHPALPEVIARAASSLHQH